MVQADSSSGLTGRWGYLDQLLLLFLDGSFEQVHEASLISLCDYQMVLLQNSVISQHLELFSWFLMGSSW